MTSEVVVTSEGPRAGDVGGNGDDELGQDTVLGHTLFPSVIPSFIPYPPSSCTRLRHTLAVMAGLDPAIPMR